MATKYLQDSNWTVRGVTRNSSSPSAQALAAKGVHIIQADLDDAKSFDEVFYGANAIFAVTDFWQPFFEKYATLKTSSDRATGEYAYDVEVARGKVIVDAAAKALQQEGKLEILVWSGLPPVRERSAGKYTYVYHFDARAAVTKYIVDTYPELNKKTSILYMGFYCNNLIKYPGLQGPKLVRRFSHMMRVEDQKLTCYIGERWVLHLANFFLEESCTPFCSTN